MQAHEEACDVRQYFVLLDMGDREAAAAMERYDAAFRQLCVERGALTAAELPFLLGQPLRDLPRNEGYPRLRAAGSPARLRAPCGGHARPRPGPKARPR